MVETEPGRRLVAFLLAPSKRGYMGYKPRRVVREPDEELA
jgi:hypothetical protein